MRAKQSNPSPARESIDCFVASAPRNDGGIGQRYRSRQIDPKRDTTDERSDCNWRRAGAGPHRPGGDRRSPQARGAAVPRPDRAHRWRAARDLHRGRARRQPLRQLSGAARLKTRRERFPRSATTRSISSRRCSAFTAPALSGCRSIPCLGPRIWTTSSAMPRSASH